MTTFVTGMHNGQYQQLMSQSCTVSGILSFLQWTWLPVTLRSYLVSILKF